ncbi:MAG: copper amine oxidase N-terminal domain-containing protein [bacterium]
MRIHRPHRILVSVAVVVALGAGLMSAAAAQTSAPYVRVFVDGSPVAFDQAPVIANGRVLVPLRGVFERLGAAVAWDPASQTVLAQRGAISVSLRIGSPQALVNGQAQLMDVPALLVGGRTMVPLRFVSQTLGADVNWDAATSAVQIASQGALSIPPSQNFPPAPPVQAQPPAPAPQPTVQTITGTVVRADAAAYPGQLIVQTASGVYTYQVVSGTSITRMNAVTGVTGPVSLSAIRPGDMVQVTADQAGTAQRIRASFSEITGTIASTGYNQIMLQSGQVYPLSPSVQVTRQSVAVSAAALQPGDIVSLRLDPQTNQVTSITVQQAAAAPGVITSVTVTPAGRQFGAGDVMTITVVGPAHGRATFSISGLRTGVPMTESAAQPGTYIGRYAIQPGDYVANVSVVVSLTAPTGQVLTATAPVPVSINAAAIIPPAAGGAPIITSPTSGSGITTPFTVTGTATPGSLVKVTADYSGTVLLFNVHGTLGSQTVGADANGNWSATFSQSAPMRGVNVTISAGVVDGSGQARSPSSTVNTKLN